MQKQKLDFCFSHSRRTEKDAQSKIGDSMYEKSTVLEKTEQAGMTEAGKRDKRGIIEVYKS